VTLVLDAGALLALERNDRAVWRRTKRAIARDEPLRTHGGVIAQVWRGGSGRQALLSRALAFVDVIGLDDELGRRAGVLLARAKLDDPIDAAVVAMSQAGDSILTSDPGDIEALRKVTGFDIAVVPV
jgi:hypothetical protein